MAVSNSGMRLRRGSEALIMRFRGLHCQDGFQTHPSLIPLSLQTRKHGRLPCTRPSHLSMRTWAHVSLVSCQVLFLIGLGSDMKVHRHGSTPGLWPSSPASHMRIGLGNALLVFQRPSWGGSLRLQAALGYVSGSSFTCGPKPRNEAPASLGCL